MVTNTGSHFDMNYIQLFKTIDSVRSKLQTNVIEVLKTVPGLPKVTDILILFLNEHFSIFNCFCCVILGLAHTWPPLLSSCSLVL